MARTPRIVVPKFIQINTQADYNKYIKPALGKGADAYGLEDIKGMWWELDDGTRLGAAKTMREIRDGIDKRPRIIFISGAGAERGITDMSLTEYAENMGMRVKDYLSGYTVESRKKMTAWSYLEELAALEGMESRMEATGKILEALGYHKGPGDAWLGEDGSEIDITDVLDNTEWSFAVKICGQLQESKNEDAIEFDAPHFKPRAYEGEYISYVLYGLDEDGDEIEELAASGNADTVKAKIKAILPDYKEAYAGLHVAAICFDENGKMRDSVVVWSADANESVKSETIEFEKGHKNSRGEDAPWVIRGHKNGKVLASFAKKGDAEDHLERMKRYKKDEDLIQTYLMEVFIFNSLKETNRDALNCDYNYNQSEAPHRVEIIKGKFGAPMNDLVGKATEYLKDGIVNNHGVKIRWHALSTFGNDHFANWSYDGIHGLRVRDAKSVEKELEPFLKKAGKSGEKAEATEDAGSARNVDINDAYSKFSGVLKAYKDRVANFMKDGVYIANSRGENGVKGLRSQGFTLNLAKVLDDDSLHLGYENGNKLVDVFFIPALNKIEVMLYGFDEYGRHQQPTKIFNVSDGIDSFAEFIESLPNYKAENNGEGAKGESYELPTKEIQVRKDGQPWSRYAVTWPEYVDTYTKEAKEHGWDEVRVVDMRRRHERLFNVKELEDYALAGMKAAVMAAWSAAEVKNFKIDVRSDSTEPPKVDIDPQTLDGKNIDVSWRILPKIHKIAQYSISPVGNSTIEREMDFTTADDVEDIFTDEFKNLDAVMDGGKEKDEKLFNVQELEAYAMNGIKSAIMAAWSAAGVRNFKINIRENPASIDVLPKTLDGNDMDVSWRILPKLGKVAQYADNLTTGNSEIEREMDFTSDDDLEALFTEEFKVLDETIADGEI